METYESRIDSLDDKLKALYNVFGNSCDNPWEKNAILSDCINAFLRSEYLYLRKDYICDFYGSKATINPDLFPEKVVINITPEEEYLYEKICANSFGPFYPKEYFKIDKKYRILWLLREPYIMPASWYIGDRGGHNQSYEFRNWEDAKTITTYHNLIKYSRLLLNGIGLKIGESAADMLQVMKHICILEVNHFPGLAFKGTDSNVEYVSKWHTKNSDLLQILVEFYNPQILIGGGTLEYFLSNKRFDTPNYKEVAEKIKTGKLKIFGDQINNWSYVTKDENENDIESSHDFFSSGEKDVLKNVKYWSDKRIYIQASQPSRINYKLAKVDIQAINSWRKTRNETD